MNAPYRGERMFEVLVALCLKADPLICRDVLVPGYETATQADCEIALAARPPGVPGPAVCAPQGPVAAFDEVAPGVFVHLGGISDAAAGNDGDVSNAAFVIGDTSAAMIDTGGSRKVGESFWRAIRARTDLPVSHAILTHMHPDHVLGASVFADAGAVVVGHNALPRALSDRSDSYLTNFGQRIGAGQFLGTRIVLPSVTVAQNADIDLGGRTLELRAWPNAHTGTDLTVGDAASGILFTGDLVFETYTPALDGSALGWQSVLSTMQSTAFTRIVPGHGGPLLAWPSGGADTARYLDLLVADTRAAIARGDTLSEAVKTVARDEADRWELFGLFNPRNATVAYTELEWE